MEQAEKKEMDRQTEVARAPLWLREYAAVNAPGGKSELQQQRTQLMKRVVPWLTQWCQEFGFTIYEQRIKPSAYFGCTAMHDEPSARLMSAYTAWLFFLDYCTDESPTLEALEDNCRQIVRPFIAGAGAEQPGLGLSLARSLENLHQGLTGQSREHFKHQDEGAVGYSLAIFMAEASAVVRAMSWERKQTLRYVQGGRRTSPITLAQYLGNSRYSIAVRASASLSLAYEDEPLLVWNRWQRAMEAGADVLRLTNDLANIEREFEEGKLNAVSLSLIQAGWDGQTPPALKDPQRLEAVAAVRKLYQQALARFDEAVTALPEDKNKPVYNNVVGGVAFTIAMYEKGDFEIPTNSDLTSPRPPQNP